MTDNEKLERLISLFKTADTCIQEIHNLMGGVAGKPWYLISVMIQSHIDELKAKVEGEEEDDEWIQTGPWSFEKI
jgi:hypothetical protein